MEKTISYGSKIFIAKTKEEYLYHKLSAILDCIRIAGSVRMTVIEEIIITADNLYGPTEINEE